MTAEDHDLYERPVDQFISAVRSTDARLENVKDVITKALPVGAIGEQARDALHKKETSVATAVVLSYSDGHND